MINDIDNFISKYPAVGTLLLAVVGVTVMTILVWLCMVVGTLIGPAVSCFIIVVLMVWGVLFIMAQSIGVKDRDDDTGGAR